MKRMKAVTGVVVAVSALLIGAASVHATPNPIVYYSFDDSVNPEIDDSGGGRHLTIPGAWSSVPGAMDLDFVQMGNAIDFEQYGGGTNTGSTSWGPCTSTSGLNYPGPGGMTVAFWHKVETDSTPLVWDYWPHVTAGETFGLGYDQTTEKAWFFARTGFTDPAPRIEADYSTPVGNWVHFAGVYDPSGYTLKLYINGQLAAEDNMPAAMRTTIAPYLFVSGSWHTTVPATVDEVRLYDTALSAVQVEALVPEPATLSLLALGGLAIMRRKL